MRGQGAQPDHQGRRPGSIEALQDSLDKMDQSEVRINTIHSAVGAINETDVVLADAPTPSSSALACVPTARPAPQPSARASRFVATTLSISASRSSTLPASACSSPPRSRSPRVPRPSWTPSRCPKSASPPVSASRRARSPRPIPCAWCVTALCLQRQDCLDAPLQGRGQEPQERFRGGIGLENFQDIKPGDQIEGYRIDQVARTE